MGREKGTGVMKNEQFILETLTGRGPLLDLVLDELLKTT
jgi:hypothetical protein